MKHQLLNRYLEHKQQQGAESARKNDYYERVFAEKACEYMGVLLDLKLIGLKELSQLGHDAFCAGFIAELDRAESVAN